MPQSNDGRKNHKHHSGSRRADQSRDDQSIPGHGHGERFAQNDSESVRRSRRYYDDSDDMIERVRRVRAAFEKRINGFQGADWRHYTKRTIVGQKRTEQASTEATPAVTPDSVERKTTLPTLPFPSDTRKVHE